MLGQAAVTVSAAFGDTGGGGCYQGCMPGRYGCHCEHACRCAGEFEECIDGPSGSGQCRCQLGYEAQCGSVSPLRPQLEVSRGAARDTLETLNFDTPAGAVKYIAQSAGYFNSDPTADKMHDTGVSTSSSSLWRVKTPLAWDNNTQWGRRQVYRATVSHSVPVPFPTLERAGHQRASTGPNDKPATVIVNDDIFPLLNLRPDQVCMMPKTK